MAIPRTHRDAAHDQPVSIGAPPSGRSSADTPSPILLIPVTNIPSYVHRATEIA